MRKLIILLCTFACAAVQAGSCQDIADQVNRQLNPRVNAQELAAVLSSLHETSHLPIRFVTKKDAMAAGWQPGQNLSKTLPGKSMGGDRFGNYERRLPHDHYREADLDYQNGRRGAKRLVFSHKRRFITVDHYRTFLEIPPCK